MRKCLSDPKLLGATLEGNSWAAWRVMLIAAMGEKLTKPEREVFTKFTGGRAHEPGKPIDEGIFCIGRRGGKDRAAAILATYIAGICDHRGVLAPGERGVVLIIAPDQRQARITLGYVEAAFRASPILAKLIANRTSDTLELTSGVAIEVRAASFRRIRGVTALAVIGSEVAFWLDVETSSNPDVEILAAARPALATTGGPLILISSPYARRGELWNLYRKHYGPDGDPAVLVVQGATRDFNPRLSQKVIDRAYERDPSAAAAEYGAQFRTDLESFVSREVVEAAVAHGRHELPPVLGTRYSAFLDAAGGSGQDAMTVAIAHRDRDRGGKVILDAVRERKPPFSPDQVTQEFAALLKTYRVHRVTGDRYAGEWPRERLKVHGIGYDVAEKPKSDLYRDLLPLLNSGRVELLDQPRLVAQICGLERRTARGGRDSIDHGPGQHDDLANAVAGAVVLAAAKHSSLPKFSDEFMNKLRTGYSPKLNLHSRFSQPRVFFGARDEM
jgi:hypothetical protein